ncbi:Mg2+ and Co2+ transporter CorA [Clostridium moniliforme]|uniref:Mg2+ and Co2+ transporter CorA n=1 Tax=Clostridium moniliforme TaxID=39489 RepID=A0ABS4F0L3_9CLOT|nr:hypothetical protein [Clostridium moniliforme]MBP1889789.1 Mg2+ and Co2+ transporter CorA [Clostridium moniliforme]
MEIKKIEKEVSKIFSLYNSAEESEYKVTISKEKDGYKFNLIDVEFYDLEYNFFCQGNPVNEDELLYGFIKDIYDKEINYRNKFIKETYNFLYRKARSLNLWLKRNNTKKVNEINEEIAFRYEENEKMKSKINEYKNLINILYSIKNQYDNTEGLD